MTTLAELKTMLGEQVKLLANPNTPYEERMKLADVSSVMASVAKQIINATDVQLRTEKLVAEGKLRESAIEELGIR